MGRAEQVIAPLRRAARWRRPGGSRKPGGDLGTGPPGDTTELAWARQTRYGRRATLISVEHLTPTGTLRLAFDVIDEEPFNFLPGQFIGIAQKLPRFGLRKSPYCLISPPTGQRRFELLVRVVPEGPLSQYLAGLDVGDAIAFRGPTGRSMAPKQSGTELVLFATGVGIGPFLGLIRYLLAVGDPRPIRLFWGLRLAADLCLLDELDELTRTHPAFDYHISLSQPPAHWGGLRGRITATAPPLVGPPDGKQFVLCGNGAMITETHAALSDLGVPDVRIHREHYFNSSHRPDADTVAEVRRQFAGHDVPSPIQQLHVVT
ncbi:MAG: ferredoxin--NADP reductase [Nitriliruptorales bacterium]